MGLYGVDTALTIHYEQAGRGDTTVLFVPGWTMSTRVFERQLKYFEKSDEIRFITFDPRAHGLSDKTTDGHDYEQHGRDLHGFIEALQLDNFILGGWSFGCLTTLAYINQFGAGRLNGFIMLDGPPRAAAEDNQSDWASYRFDDADGGREFFTAGRIGNPDATNREFVAGMLEDKSEDNIQWLLEITRRTPDKSAALLIAKSIFLDYRADLRALEGKMPLWYLVRAERRAVVLNWAQENTPSAQVQAFGGHLMFWERADEFNQALTQFVIKCKQ